MGKYPLHPDFAKLAMLRPPIMRPLLPLINGFLRLMQTGYRGRNGIRLEKLTIPREDGTSVKALLYTPDGCSQSAPCLIYFHGGGFVMALAPQQDRMVRYYTKETPCKTLLVDYRLAPKHPFPAGVEDCYRAYRWVVEHAKTLGIAPDKIALGGDSAGGNLTAAVALMARDRGLPKPCFQMLIYPVTDRRKETASMKHYTDTPMWDAKKSRLMWECYLPTVPGAHIEYASPMEAESLANLPDAYVEVTQFDCLRDEGIAYAKALEQAGSHVELREIFGAVHGFELMANSAVVHDCMLRRTAALQRAFGLDTADKGESNALKM